jgi:hypothetical protein
MKTVNDRARAMATFRHVAVKLMEMVARWTPTTPEMEAKLMFGRHIWDYAQMADALGKRTFELRQPEQYSLRPAQAYAELLDQAAARRATADRVAVLYDALLPGLIDRCRRYVRVTDPILDEPSIVILERSVRDLERHRMDAATLQREINLGAGTAAGIAALERAIDDIVAESVQA